MFRGGPRGSGTGRAGLIRPGVGAGFLTTHFSHFFLTLPIFLPRPVCCSGVFSDPEGNMGRAGLGAGDSSSPGEDGPGEDG